jgi:hypothetical protein
MWCLQTHLAGSSLEVPATGAKWVITGCFACALRVRIPPAKRSTLRRSCPALANHSIDEIPTSQAVAQRSYTTALREICQMGSVGGED